MHVFVVYITLLSAEICDIGNRSFPKFVASRHLTNFSPQGFRIKTFLYSLYKFLTANSNTLSPLVVTRVVTFRQ